jgi:hypothetical protein
MRRSAVLCLLAPAMLAAQTAKLDDGRLEPSWFGAEVVLQPSKTLGFQWLKPGLTLHQRSLQLKAWEPAVWLRGRRMGKDQAFLQRAESYLATDLERGLRRGLKGSLPLSSTAGDVLVIARVVDAVGIGDNYMDMGQLSLSFDLKLVEAGTGILLAAFHDTLRGPSPEAIAERYSRWCEDLGRLLAASALPPVAAQVVSAPTPTAIKPTPATLAIPTTLATPTPPPFDLEGALRRIEGLKRDGLLSEEECQVLRKKAADKAADKAASKAQ